MTHIRNYLIFPPEGGEAVIRIRDHIETDRQITDPVTRQPKTVRALELHLEWANGAPTEAVYSSISDKEYAMWSPYLADRSYRGKTFRIRKTGAGFRRETSLEVLP